MDGTTISNAGALNVGQFTAQKNSAAAKNAYGAYANTAQQATAINPHGDAFSVNISDAAKAAQAQQETETVDDAGTQKTKGLSADEIQALKDDLAAQEQTMLNLMIQVMMAQNDKLQGWLDEGTGILNFGGIKIDASRFALPEVATNPEDAAKAVAEGGAWSVGAVSDRIFGLAEALAGGNPEKLEEMRAAVEEGFKQAGMVWKDATGQDSMPEITKQTYTEIMNRFSKAQGNEVA